MAVRHEKVVLEADISDFTTKMAKAAVASRGLAASLDNFDGTNKRAAKSTGTVTDEVDRLNRAVRRDDGINQLTGRLRLARDVAATLGPALIPIGAVGIPAVSGLASELGFATTAGLSLVAAAQGVGDALSSLDAYRLDPTATNLEKARDAMSRLGPDARQFVESFTELRPVLDQIRDQAAAGWFPGLTDALGDLERLAPSIGDLFETIGAKGGSLLAEGAASLADSPDFAQFLAFVESSAPQALDDLGRTVGNLAAGMGELWMAFDPLNADFGSFMVDAARDFRDWADGLSQTEGFRDFIDYIQTNGPRVADAAASIGNALVQIVQAAAPLGGPVLDGISAVADVVAAVADSDLGTPIFTAVAAYSALNRVLATTVSLQSRFAATQTTGAVSGQVAAADAALLGGNLSKSTAGVKSFGAALTTVTSAQDRARMSAAELSRVEAERSATLRGGFSTMGRAAGLIGGLTLASSGAADSIGMTNTASLALMGTMAGPWGAAAGGVAGAFMDVKAGMDAASESAEQTRANLTAALNAGDLTAMKAALHDATAAGQEFSDSVDPTNLFGNPMDRGTFMLSELKEWAGFGDSAMTEYENAARDAAQTTAAAQTAVRGFAQMLGGDLADAARRGDLSAQDFADTVQQISPLLADAGVSMERYVGLQRMASTKTGVVGFMRFEAQDQLDLINTQLERQIRYSESAAGRADALGNAWTSLDAPALTIAQSAGQVTAALDAMINPQMALVGATDAWTTSLRTFGDDLSRTNRTLVGNSNAAIQNRAAFNARVTQLQASIKAEAEAGASGRQLARSLRDQRNGLLRAGEAAGLSRRQMQGLLRQYELTPKQVRTLIKQTGADAASTAVRKLRREYDGLPTMVRADIKTNGIPKTMADVDRLVAKYKLGEKPRQALITLKDDAARQGITKVNQLLDDTEHKKTEPKLTVDNSQAQQQINAVETWLNQIPDEHVTVWVTRKERKATGGLVGGYAGGGQILGAGGPTDDRIPAMLSNREFVMPVSAVDRYGLSFMEQVRSGSLDLPGFSGGGYAGSSRDLAAGRGAEVDETARSLKNLNKQLREAEKALQRETSERDKVVSAMNSLKSSVVSGLTTDVFGQEVDPFSSANAAGSAAGVTAQLDQDAADARAFVRAVKTLKSKGLDGRALAELLATGDVDLAQMYASLPASELRDYEQAYKARSRALSQAGAVSGNAVYGAELRQQTQEMKAANKRLEKIEAAIKRHDKNNQDGHDRSSQRVVNGVNGAASRGRRNQPRNRVMAP